MLSRFQGNCLTLPAFRRGCRASGSLAHVALHATPIMGSAAQDKAKTTTASGLRRECSQPFFRSLGQKLTSHRQPRRAGFSCKSTGIVTFRQTPLPRHAGSKPFVPKPGVYVPRRKKKTRGGGWVESLLPASPTPRSLFLVVSFLGLQQARQRTANPPRP